jgi:processing peptidase subunit beta
MYRNRQVFSLFRNAKRNFLKTSPKSYSSNAPAIDTAFDSNFTAEAIPVPSYQLPEFLLRSPGTQITTLSNGVKVVTDPRVGETASVGVFIKAGSRNENKSNNGVAHFLEHMYFKGTKKRSARALEVEFENAGALMNAHTSREYTAFTSHCLKGDVDRSVDCLADVLLNSELKEEDIENERSTILREMEEVNLSIEEALYDELHASAFQKSSLGFTILGPKENILSITRKQMLDFRDTHYIAPKMALVAVGDVDHEELVKLGETYFSNVPTSPINGRIEKPDCPNYIGSDVRIQNDEIPNLHMAIAFQGPGLTSADILVISIIQLLLGSYDRTMGAGRYIPQNLANTIAENNLARLCLPFNHAYSDTGLFGVQTISTGEEEGTDALMCEIVHQMTKLCFRVFPEEVERAKNIFKTQILAQYEGNLRGVLEEAGRQILFYGRRPSAAEMFARIDAITVDDVKRVATKYIHDQDPVLAAIGQTEEMIDYNWLRSFTVAWRL